MSDQELSILSGRLRPNLAPLYRLYSGLTGVRVTQDYVYHMDVAEKLTANAGKFDVLITNSQVRIEAARALGLFEPYDAGVARAYEPWLRAADYGWLSFTAWPRSVMVNRQVLPDPKSWPTRMEDFTTERFRNKVALARIGDETTVSQLSAVRVAKGDKYAFELFERMLSNGLRNSYASNKDTRDRLIPDKNAVALVNSSNIHVFFMEGNPVGEAWTDQESGGMGTHVEAHVVAVVRDAPHPDGARRFVDWLLSVEPQTILARMYGETPVNPNAVHGAVRPLSEIRRIDVPLAKVAALRESTRNYLKSKGMDAPPDSREDAEKAFKAMTAS